MKYEYALTLLMAQCKVPLAQQYYIVMNMSTSFVYGTMKYTFLGQITFRKHGL